MQANGNEMKRNEMGTQRRVIIIPTALATCPYTLGSLMSGWLYEMADFCFF